VVCSKIHPQMSRERFEIVSQTLACYEVIFQLKKVDLDE